MFWLGWTCSSAVNLKMRMQVQNAHTDNERFELRRILTCFSSLICVLCVREIKITRSEITNASSFAPQALINDFFWILATSFAAKEVAWGVSLTCPSRFIRALESTFWPSESTNGISFAPQALIDNFFWILTTSSAAKEVA